MESEIQLREVAHYRSGLKKYELYRGDVKIGEVEQYWGTINKKIKGSRLIIPGKRRVLWCARPVGASHATYQHRSRKEAVSYAS